MKKSFCRSCRGCCRCCRGGNTPLLHHCRETATSRTSLGAVNSHALLPLLLLPLLLLVRASAGNTAVLVLVRCTKAHADRDQRSSSTVAFHIASHARAFSLQPSLSLRQWCFPHPSKRAQTVAPHHTQQGARLRESGGINSTIPEGNKYAGEPLLLFSVTKLRLRRQGEDG